MGYDLYHSIPILVNWVYYIGVINHSLTIDPNFLHGTSKKTEEHDLQSLQVFPSSAHQPFPWQDQHVDPSYQEETSHSATTLIWLYHQYIATISTLFTYKRV